ncbi:hypothetical protein ACJX0J_027809, partial [Zea mays]
NESILPCLRIDDPTSPWKTINWSHFLPVGVLFFKRWSISLILPFMYPDFGGFTWTNVDWLMNSNKKHAFLIDYKYYYTANLTFILWIWEEQYVIYVGGINLRSTLLYNM